MKLVVFEAEPREASAFDALKAQNHVIVTNEPLRNENAGRYAQVEAVSTFIYSELDRHVLQQMPTLKLIATRSTGIDHIDAAYCAEHGIAISNVPTYGENTVAEHVFALLLAISHKIIEAAQRTRDGHFSLQGLQGFDLFGKTIGVVGTGSIGRNVIRIARGFRMNVIAHDINSDTRTAQTLDFRYASFDEVLAVSDILTLHVPATPKTHNMLADEQFARMKHGAIIINTARGSLIDHRALILALRSGKVAAAGLDVLPDEPAIREEAELICSMFCDRHDLRNLVADHVLLKMPNVVVTPHTAFNTREAVRRILDTTIENIQAFAAGRPRNVVTMSA